MPQYGSDDQLKLFCLFFNAPGNSFPVVIRKGATVDVLKNEIKNDNGNFLALIDARTLKLWKLSQPIPFAEIHMKVKLDQSPQEIPGCIELDSGDELLEHFSSVPHKHVHIIVEVPPPSSREYSCYLFILPNWLTRKFPISHQPSSTSKKKT
ncbi:hypothetical protein APHAL10511_001523 [Amanita phalloides]|nr:hypothetical protein APHAL10511_001523 [Amanita phalloides]